MIREGPGFQQTPRLPAILETPIRDSLSLVRPGDQELRKLTWPKGLTRRIAPPLEALGYAYKEDDLLDSYDAVARKCSLARQNGTTVYLPHVDSKILSDAAFRDRFHMFVYGTFPRQATIRLFSSKIKEHPHRAYELVMKTMRAKGEYEIDFVGSDEWMSLKGHTDEAARVAVMLELRAAQEESGRAAPARPTPGDGPLKHSVIGQVIEGVQKVRRFRELALLVRRGEESLFGYAAQRSPSEDSLEFLRDGQIVATVPVADLRISNWNGTSYRALSQRVEANLKLLIETFERDVALAPDESARMSARMQVMIEELCRDIQAIIHQSEMVLGITLPDGYQLHEVCES
jgi:hypothetical protein